MTESISRRHAIATGATAAFGAATLSTYVASPASSAQATNSARAQQREETKSLDTLYQDALAEGGSLVVYAGGDTPTQQDAAKEAFLTQFPKIKLAMIVDYSKFHDVRVDNQFATDTLVADVVQLQTLQDFPRWNQQGRLLHYKPAGFSKVYDKFKDPQGAWTAIRVSAFSLMYDVAAAGKGAPMSPKELVNPEWSGKIASSYPNDDDAVLYLYKLYAEAYGWDWIAKLAAQNMQFARGSNAPGVAVDAHQKVIGLGGSGSLITPSTAPTKWVVSAGHPFLGWGQRAAILKGAKHLAAAKLYMNWQLSVARQQAASNGWAVRTDVTPAGGLKPIWEYPNANVAGFVAFMADRAEAERWRQTFTLYFGEVKGDPSPGRLGLHPGG
jgi:ABC-type Fe3+ transport system substrate-binding protein